MRPLGLLGALGVAVLILGGCVEAEPAAPGDHARIGAASPDTPVRSNAAPAGPSSSDAPKDCGAEKARQFVGRKADEDTRARLREAVSPVSTIRWVGPGDATTEDYSLSRLNVMLDPGGTIRSVHCG